MFLVLSTALYIWLLFLAIGRSNASLVKATASIMALSLFFIYAQFSMNLGETNPLISAAALLLAFAVLISSILCLVLVSLKPFRFSITKWFYRSLKKSMPTISNTEMTVINAGNTWIEKSILQGAIDWYELSKIKISQLTAEEQRFLDNEVHELCSLVSMEETKKTRNLPPKAWKYIKEKGFLGLILPKKYGGLEFSATAHSAVVGKLATCSQPLAVSVMVPNSLGPGELLIHYGTEEQKKHYLPRLAAGKDIPCFALTSPSAGSDAGSIDDYGIVCMDEYKGNKTLGLRLQWEKRYITLSPIATLLGLAFKAYDPDGLLPQNHPLKGKKKLGITLAIIPTDLAGIQIGNRHDPMGVAFQNGPNRGKDVFIPMEYIVGGIDRIGQGWKMLTECLSIGRGISLPSLSVAGCKHALLATTSYATVREQFNLPIARFEAIGDRICTLAQNSFATSAAQRLTSTAIDSGVVPAVVTAMVKYKNTELLRDSVNSAFDIHGGRAIMCGPRNYLEEMYRSVPVAITVEGANILTQSLIVFGQGILRCHPYLLEEVKALQSANEADAVRALEKQLFPHFGYVITNASASLAYAYSFGRLAPSIGKGVLKRLTQAISATSNLLSFVSDLSLLSYGGALKRKEIASSKFATIWTNLYYAIACVKAFQATGEQKNLEGLLRITVLDLIYEARSNLKDIVADLPIVGSRLLSSILMPTQRPFGHVSSKARVQIAEEFCSTAGLRSTVSENVFRTTDLDSPMTRIENAFQAVSNDKYRIIAQQLKKLPADAPVRLGGESVADWLKRLVDAELLTEEQKRLYLHTKALVRDAIMVDEFNPKDFSLVKQQ